MNVKVEISTLAHSEKILYSSLTPSLLERAFTPNVLYLAIPLGEAMNVTGMAENSKPFCITLFSPFRVSLFP